MAMKLPVALAYDVTLRNVQLSCVVDVIGAYPFDGGSRPTGVHHSHEVRSNSYGLVEVHGPKNVGLPR